MSDTPSRNPVMQRLQVLLSGGGYNFYDKANQARADDLMVRQHASQGLTQAAQSLRALEAEYRRRFLPPSTREQPYPPPEVIGKLRRLGQIREQIGGLEGDIRGMAAPAQDKFWWRLRQEVSLLNALIAFDDALVQQTAEIEQLVATWTAEEWQAADPSAALMPLLPQLSGLIRDRRQLLIQPWV